MSANTGLHRSGGPAAQEAAFLDAAACAARYGISPRTWLRLVESGRAPSPTRFGRLVRWPVIALVEWERAGCQGPSGQHSGHVA